MPKVIFILKRTPGTSREECLDRWSAEQHVSLVGGIPGLMRWLQSHVASAPAEHAACDGIGELWFDGDETMQQALRSPQIARAAHDALEFLDMRRTGMVIVDENTVIERIAA